MNSNRILFLAVVAGLLSSRVVFATEPPVTAVAFAPDGKPVAAVSQSGVHVFSWPQLQPQKTIDNSASNLHCLAFSPDGNQLAVGGGNPSEAGTVEIFSWPDGESTAIIDEHEDSVTAICWRDASQLFSASLDRDIKLHELQPSKKRAGTDGGGFSSTARLIYKGHSRGASALCLLNDGNTLVSVGRDQSVRVWDVLSGDLIRSLSQHTKPIHAVVLRPAGGGLPMVASAAGDRTIRFWQPTIGRMVRYVRLEAEPLNIAWTNDGARLLAVCVDGRLRVIDPLEVTVVQNLPAIDGWAYAIAVHPSGASAVVGGADGQLQKIELRGKTSRPTTDK